MPPKRVLHLVRDCGGHLTDGGQPVAQTLAFLELFHASQILEEHRRADHLVVVVSDEREGVADDPPRKTEPELRAIREQVQIEDVREQAHHLWVVAQNLRDRSSDVVGAARDPENAIRLIVDDRQSAVAIQRQYAVPHARHDVSEERVLHGAVSCGRLAQLVRSTAAGPEGQPGAARRLDFVIAICSTGLDPCTTFDP